MDEIIKNWEKIKDIIKQECELSDTSYEAWIKPMTIGKIVDKEIFIPCEDSLHLNYINKKYINIINDIVKEYGSKDYEVKLVLSSDLDKSVDNENLSTNSSLNNVNNVDNIGLNPSYTFENFVIGKSNQFARAASLAVAESPGEIYNPLYLYGDSGLGKTHLMQSIAHFIHKHNPEKKVVYVSSDTFTNELIQAIRNKNDIQTNERFREKYRNIDVLCIDDIQFIIGKEATQEEFFHTFEQLYLNNKQIIITSDRNPKEMTTLDERIRSRFECGLMADIGQPDYETRMAILHKKEEKDHININPEIIDYIASNVKSNVRELEGAFNRIAAKIKLSGNMDSEFDLEFAKKELADIVNPDVKREITIQLIVETVAEYYNITLEQMMSKKRTSDIARPRMIAMYLAKNMTDSSLDAIGASLGGRDHSTVIHGVNKINDDIMNSDEFRQQIDTIKRKINPA
ncbi:MAG: chromosomal replication initiator protein DnaA [Lachnospiraceae bacterium]|nr:chromosomal replication initiator protein DnaA [Lachnospiraceae bacterium]